jgi:hypothetical protein
MIEARKALSAVLDARSLAELRVLSPRKASMLLKRI